MFGKHYSLALTVVCAAVSLLLATAPASAARGGGYRGGGDRGGWSGGDRGGWSGGYRGGWYGGDRGGWNGGYWGGGRYWGGGYGGGYYPGYYDNYYSAPAVDYTPSYYYTPPTTVVVTPDTAAPDTRARVEVRVPAPDAQVFFDGAATQQQGTDRMFSSPPLNPGQTYNYNIEARWMENGRMKDMTKSVTVTPGETAVVDFGQ